MLLSVALGSIQLDEPVDQISTEAVPQPEDVSSQLFLCSLVAGLLISGGLIFCLLPGIYLAVAWQFALPLIIDKRLDFWPAMELSRKIITRHWWSFFGLALLSTAINLVGTLLCGVGAFVTAPVTMLALMYAYEDIIGATTPSQALQPL